MRWIFAFIILGAMALAQNAYGPDYLNLHCTTPDPLANTLFNIPPRPGLVPNVSQNGNMIFYCDAATGTLKSSLNGSAYVPIATPSTFIPFSGNPILASAGPQTVMFLGSMLKNPTGTGFICYYSAKVAGTTNIYRCTSPDGQTITRSPTDPAVFTPSAGSNWDSGAIVDTPLVWTENNGQTYNMMYTANDLSGNARAGLATSTDGISWTRAAVNNCSSTTGNGCVIDLGVFTGDNSNIELSSIIKVGSTYYAPISSFTASGVRITGNCTSTNLTTWTKESAATFSGGYYDAAIWVQGKFYYMAIDHSVGGAPGAGTVANIDLFRDVAPTFEPVSRTFLGVIKQSPGTGSAPWDAYLGDELFVAADDITRSTFVLTGGNPWLYYSSSGTSTHTDFGSGILQSTPFQTSSGFVTTYPSISNAFFPYSLIATNICIAPTTGFTCPQGLVTNVSGGIQLGSSTATTTPMQFYEAYFQTSGTTIPAFLAADAADFWGIGSATTGASDHIIQLGSVSGPGQAWAGTQNLFWTAQGYTVPMKATASLTIGQVVKLDTANANSVVVTATTDTGGGIAVGIMQTSPGAGATGYVLTSGITAAPILGTGTCSIGNFVIVDTTTAGRVQCTAAYTAGTVIGKALTAQASVGSAVTVLVGLR